MSLETADLYARRYRLVREIGKGGMGSVWEALEVALDRVVAVKRMTPGKMGKSTLEARQRFRREVTAAARLTHPGIAQVLGYGTTDEGEHYIAMELVNGQNLRQELKQVATIHDVLVLFDQILAAIAYAHARKVVHSDLKPDNVLVTRVGSAPLCKLLDFGVAKVDRARGVAEEPIDDDDIVFGTPRYMAPEQVRGLTIGPAADLYAIGVMLYEALTGSLPIPGRGDQVMQNKLREPAPPLEQTRFAIPASAALSQMCAQLLERDPSRRIQSAADTRTLLAACPEAAGEARLFAPAPSSQRPNDAPETVRIAKGATGLDPARILPFVGRKHERARLADALARVCETGEASLVLVEGGTGIGKTHLLEWFTRQLREEGGRTVLHAAYVEGGGPEGDAVRAALERHVGAWGLGKQEVGRAVGTFLDRHGGPDADEECALTDFLRPDASAASRGSGEGRRSFTLALIERTLRRLAVERPLVVALDDLGAGGRSAVEMLSFLLAMWRQAPCRVLVVAGVRLPSDDVDFARAYRRALASEGNQVVRLRLQPLAQPETLELAAAVAGDDAGSELARIAARAAGNPLFAIGLARLARQSRDAATQLPPGGSIPPGSGGPLPENVAQLLEARVDAAVARAPEPEVATAVLTELAVLLPPVATTLLEKALAGANVETGAAEAALDSLVDSGIVREVSVANVESLDLDHPLLVDVLRARLSQRALRSRSARAFTLKEADAEHRSERRLHELARHALDAGLDDRVASLCLDAVEHALAAGAYADAAALLGRMAAGARGWSEQDRVRLALLAARTADEAGDAKFAEEALEATLAGDGPAAIEAALALARLASRAGRLADADRAIDRARAALGRVESGAGASAGHRAQRAELLRLQASVARRRGTFVEAIALLEEALRVTDGAAGDATRLIYDNLAWARHRAGDAQGAIEAARRALEAAPAGLSQGWALRTVAVIGRDTLPAAERREHLEHALSIARGVGALRLLASALTHLGELERQLGNVQAALACFRQVVRIGTAMADHDDLSESLANLSMMLVDEGQTGRAGDALAARAEQHTSWDLGLRLVGAALRAAIGDVEGASSVAAEIRVSQTDLPSCWGVARAAERLGAALGEARHDDLATWVLGQAASAWSRLGEREASARAEALLAEVTGDPTEEGTRRDVPFID